MKKRIHIIEEVTHKTTWILSIGNKAPWDNVFQVPIPGVVAKRLLKFLSYSFSKSY